MRQVLLWLLPVLLLAPGPGSGAKAQLAPGSNDHIFPPAAAARPFIDFDDKGFLVKGRRIFLVSAGMEYARVPHELWQDRLLRLKRAGFNCVEIYTFWNFHEPREGHFDFSGDHDLDAFLQMVNRMGMYAIVRVGPYYCAEWDNGGYPLWLRFKEGVRVREDNAAFEKYTDRFFDRLLPIVSKNQIHHGGAVILVQLENEHPKGWGTAMPDGYFRHLRDKALSLGLEVPYFFSGLHHSNDPAGDQAGDKPGDNTGDGGLDDAARPNPWLSTEFWSVWFTGYSSGEKEAREYERRTWKIIEHGGNGYNYYMAHGGSNFGYTNNDEDAASYDYGAAVGQAGDLRPIYYSFKRAAWFARSFRDILANSEDATAGYRDLLKKTSAGTGSESVNGTGGAVIRDTVFKLTARHSLSGDLLFLDNPSGDTVSARVVTAEGLNLPAVAPLRLSPGEIIPLVHHFPISPAVTLDWSAARILGIAAQGKAVTIVIFGDPGSPAEMHFLTKGIGRARITEGGGSGRGDQEGREGLFLDRPGHVDLQAKFSSAVRPKVYSFVIGQTKVRILTMSKQLADRTWFIEKNGQTEIVCGPDYAGERDGDTLVTERPWKRGDQYPVELFGVRGSSPLVRELAAAKRETDGVPGMGTEQVLKLTLSPWQVSGAFGCSAPGYDDRLWKAGEDALQMGADGDLSADAWYRTKITAAEAGEYTLQVEGSDRATAFVDGIKNWSGSAKAGEISLRLTEGPHVLAIFTAHDGRDKLAAYLGPIDSSDRKGLFGKAVLKKGGPSIRIVSGWHFLRASSAQDVQRFPVPGTVGWQDYTIGEDAFSGKEGYGWFRARVDSLPAAASKIALAFRSVDENATVFINGHRIGGQDGWNRPFQLIADGIDTISGEVILTVFISNYSNEGGIDQPVRVNSLRGAVPVTGWRMRGGPGDPLAIKDWKRWSGGEGKIGGGGKVEGEEKSGGNGRGVCGEPGPCFFRSYFTAPPYREEGTHAIWRVMTTGLGHGSVWVNGHNLGRYPEKTPAPGLFIPECWLKAGENSLIIYDEDGKGPGQVSVAAERAASRDLEILRRTGRK